MIYFLNRGLILEQVVEKALETYFSLLRTTEHYRNYSISITNDHPFAQLLLDKNQDISASSLFPVIVVATEDDIKPAELSALIDGMDSISIEPEDIAGQEDGGSMLENRYDMITPEIMNELRESMDKREDKRIFGSSFFIRRRDRISIEIWAENPQLKNELYEHVRLFVCGFMRIYLARKYKEHFPELPEDGESPLVIFDSSVRGQRSNNFNIEFGIELHGGQITFEADYIIEQTVIDTDLVDAKNLLLEVFNHVKAHEHITREWVAAIGEIGESDIAELTGTGSGEQSADTGTGENEKSEPETDGSPEGEKETDG